jgi:hypothetical protein
MNINGGVIRVAPRTHRCPELKALVESKNQTALRKLSAGYLLGIF